jgi:hypothetical protein
MYEELYNTVPNPDALLSTKYYEYSADGNVTRIITEYPPSGGQQNAASWDGSAAPPGCVQRRVAQSRRAGIYV